MSTALTCVRTVRAYLHTYVRVGEGASEVSVAENERRGTGTPGEAAIITKKRFVPEKFYHCMLAMNIKFALEQPSGTGVGHELA